MKSGLNYLGVLKGRAKKPGLPPGSLVFNRDEVTAPVEISIINFNEGDLVISLTL